MSDVHGYFECVASEWDGLRRGFFRDELATKALAVAGVERDRLAVDVGAGSGFLTGALLERGLAVVAVDPVPAMLAALRERIGPTPALETRVGAAERLPLEEGSADYVFANMVLHHLEDPALALREMARVLRPGGRLVVSDLDAHQHEFLRREQHDRWLGFERSRVERWFREAGLREVRVEAAGETCCATSCDGEEAKVSIFLASGAKHGSAPGSPAD